MSVLDIDFSSTALFLGWFYGITFSLVTIISNFSPTKAKFWLGVWVGLFSLILFDSWGTLVGLSRVFPPFGYTYYRCVSLIPLSVWFYVQGLTDTSIRVGWLERAAGGVVAVELFILILCAATRGALFGEYFWTTGLYFDLTGIGLAVVFIYKSIRRLYHHRQQLANNYTYYEQRSLRWLSQLLIILVILMSVWIPVVLVNAYVDAIDISFVWLWGLMALTVFFIGIKGYLAPDIIHDFEMVPAYAAAPHGARTASRPPVVLPVPSGPAASALPYEKLTEPPTAAPDDPLASQLVDLMEEQRLYRSPKLSVKEVADRLHASPRHVSSLINQRFGVTFSDFVNRHRVEEVQERIRQGDTATYTLLAIGLDAGFNSKSAFYHTFRQFAQMTPAQFRETCA